MVGCDRKPKMQSGALHRAAARFLASWPPAEVGTLFPMFPLEQGWPRTKKPSDLGKGGLLAGNCRLCDLYPSLLKPACPSLEVLSTGYSNTGDRSSIRLCRGAYFLHCSSLANTTSIASIMHYPSVILGHHQSSTASLPWPERCGRVSAKHSPVD